MVPLSLPWSGAGGSPAFAISQAAKVQASIQPYHAIYARMRREMGCVVGERSARAHTKVCWGSVSTKDRDDLWS